MASKPHVDRQPTDAVSVAGCVILDERRRVLLLHRCTTKASHWEMPGGKVEPEEAPRAAATREAKEELGIDVRIEKLLGSRRFIQHGKGMYCHWYLASVTDGCPVVRESHIHDAINHFDWDQLRAIDAELSPNVRNFLRAYDLGELRL